MKSEEIREMRRTLRLSQLHFAVLLEVHRSTVGRWERGRNAPSPRSLARLRACAPMDPAARSVPPPDRLAMPQARELVPIDTRQRCALVQADCFDVLQTLPPASIDALITDPPYSSGGLHAGDRKQSPKVKYELNNVAHERANFDGDQRDQRAWTSWCADWMRHCSRALKVGGVVAVFCDWRQLPCLSDAMQQADLVWRGVAVWDKTEGARPTRGRPRNQCEYILWGSHGNLAADRGTPTIPGVHREAVRQADKHHLTGKPVGVMRWLAKLTRPDGLIFDPFAGSASTGVGALLEGRRFLGVERDAHYAGIAHRRLEAAAAGVVLTAAQSGGQAVKRRRSPAAG